MSFELWQESRVSCGLKSMTMRSRKLELAYLAVGLLRAGTFRFSTTPTTIGLHEDLERLGIESHMYRHSGPDGNLEFLYWDEEDSPKVEALVESYGFKMYSEEELEKLKTSPSAADGSH